MENNIVEENKKKNLIIGVTVCVIILIVAALVYFLFIKKDDKKETNGKENNQQEKANDDGVAYKPWMNYLLEQNITNIELIEYPCPEDQTDRNIKIDKDKLKDIFKKLSNYKMKLSYSIGIGGACGQSLSIKYLKNGVEYEFQFGPVYFSSSISDDGEDKDFDNALSNSVDVKDENGKDEEGAFAIYDLDSEEELLDEFFK